jgi:hypothetical protein
MRGTAAKGTGRVHLEVEKKPEWAFNMGLCGWSDIQASADLTKVTCKSCLRLLRPKRTKRPETPMRVALAPLLAPVAAPPPRLTSSMWRDSCKGGQHRRCGHCELCAWEREADWCANAAHWMKRHTIERPQGAPRWSSLSAALVAFAEFQVHDRCAPSAMGPMLDRVKSGSLGDGGRSRPEDKLLLRAGELVAVRQALERAYPEGAHALPAPVRMQLLLERTPGIRTPMLSYEELAARERVAVGDVQALVRGGRERVTLDLVERGLIPPRELTRQLRRQVAATAGWR